MLTGISRGPEKEGARRVREGLGTHACAGAVPADEGGTGVSFHTGLWPSRRLWPSPSPGGESECLIAPPSSIQAFLALELARETAASKKITQQIVVVQTPWERLVVMAIGGSSSWEVALTHDGVWGRLSMPPAPCFHIIPAHSLPRLCWDSQGR